jgi:3D (Asp-Asp-Asp) domain-containing protein
MGSKMTILNEKNMLSTNFDLMSQMKENSIDIFFEIHVFS